MKTIVAGFEDIYFGHIFREATFVTNVLAKLGHDSFEFRTGDVNFLHDVAATAVSFDLFGSNYLRHFC